MTGLQRFWDAMFPDAVFYALIAVIFLFGIVRCALPVLRNASSLRHARQLLLEGSKAKLARPVWTDPSFIGKELQPVWRGFLQSADMGASSGVATDVADYVHDDVIISEPGKASLALLIPGLCTSLGILGTFVGLSMGLNGLDVMEIGSYTQLTSGISLAFNTSIVGIIASIAFNVFNSHAIGRARTAEDEFIAAFYAHAIPQPVDTSTQLLSYEHDQARALAAFAEDMSVHIGGEIQHAIATAMTPVTRTMEDFMHAATRAQVDGLDYIVARFIDRMNKALDGELKKLGQALSETADGQIRAQAKLLGIVGSIDELAKSVVDIHGVSEQLVARFDGYVGAMGSAYKEISNTQADTQDALQDIGEASLRQAKYLSALQEYQSQFQASFQEYTIWTDKFVGGLEERTGAQNAAMEQIAMEMRASGELLRGAYKSFTEAVELGLANALGLFDENMQTLMRQVNGTLSDIQSTMGQLEETVRRASAATDTDRENTLEVS